MSILFKNGLIVTASGSFPGDVYVEGEKIRAVGRELDFPSREVIDATDKYLLPGAIDPHTHIHMPYLDFHSQDDFESGTKAAACGGVTTLIDFVDQRPGHSLKEALAEKQEEAAGEAVVDYAFSPAVVDPRPEVIEELQAAIHQYGTPSFKVYMFYDFRLDDYTILKLLGETKKHGGLIQVHAESNDFVQYLNELYEREGKRSLPYHAKAHAVLAEEDAVDRITRMVELTGSRIYIVHLSTARGLSKIRQARTRGVEIYAETCPQYLTLAEDRYLEEGWQGAKYIISPPLRPRENLGALWNGLDNGHIQTVATDHCPFDLHGVKDRFGKEDYKKIPNGAAGIETLLMLMHSEGVVAGRISLERMVEVLSTNTARLFGLRDKGAIAAGKDADLVLFDPRQKLILSQEKLHMKVDYTPWEGWEVTGVPEAIYCRGQKVAAWDGTGVEFIGPPGWGRFVKRRPFHRP